MIKNTIRSIFIKWIGIFIPTGVEFNVNGKNLSLQPQDDINEFYKVNKELIDYLKKINRWDH